MSEVRRRKKAVEGGRNSLSLNRLSPCSLPLWALPLSVQFFLRREPPIDLLFRPRHREGAEKPREGEKASTLNLVYWFFRKSLESNRQPALINSLTVLERVEALVLDLKLQRVCERRRVVQYSHGRDVDGGHGCSWWWRRLKSFSQNR